MTINAVTYFEVRCNEPGCKNIPDEDYAAWADRDYAEQNALDADWSIVGDDAWCFTHRPKCEPGKHKRDYPDDRCKRCGQWPEDDEEADEIASTGGEG